jgi:hypothetical protein
VLAMHAKHEDLIDEQLDQILHCCKERRRNKKAA